MEQYAKERRKLEREQAHKNFESSADFLEAPRPHTLETPHGGVTATTANGSFAAVMEYAAALEEKYNMQFECIIDIEASVDGQTVITEATYFAAIAVATGGANKELKERRVMMKQFTAAFTSQAEPLEALSTNTNSGSGGSGGSGGKDTDKKKARPGLHVCAHCNREVYHKEVNYLELEANQSKRYTGCKSVFTKE